VVSYKTRNPLKKISTLQYITHLPTDDAAYYAHIQSILQEGINWIQYRDKLNPPAVQLIIASKIQALCKQFEAVFIVNDYIDLAKQLDADGAHIGQNDMPIASARAILGPSKIIGTSSNSIANIKKAIAEEVDYSGIGPLHFTKTKTNLNPVIEYENMQAIFQQLKAEKIEFPLVVIGGISNKDVPLLLSFGAKGIAVATFLANAADVPTACQSLLSQLPTRYF
jgi:thiamine-phosphate pyrophosphorylase